MFNQTTASMEHNCLVPFTQYLRPEGRPRQIYTAVKPETKVKADKILEAGLVFEIEVLRNDLVSMTISQQGVADLQLHVCNNGPEVPLTVERMIMDFDLEKFLDGQAS